MPESLDIICISVVRNFYGGDGIVTKGVEATLRNVGRLGKEGMRETNEEIIKMMIED